MRLSISRTLLAIYVVTGLSAFAAVGFVSNWVKDRAVTTLAAAESRRNAELVFQSLYAVMRKGWSKADIVELIDGMNATVPDIHIAVYRSQQVSELFGELERDRRVRESDPLVARAINGAGETLEVTGGTLRFLYPVVVGEECLGCHGNAAVGSVNGVIDIRFPVEKLRVPLDFTMDTLIAAFATVLGLVSLLVLLKVRYLVAAPISRMAGHIEHIMRSGDLGRRIGGKAFWLNELCSVTDAFNSLMDQLQQSRAELVARSVTDALTGLHNRRHFSEALAQEIERSQRYGHAFSVVMMDLDGFKPINDIHGHAVGDEVLKSVAAAIAGSVRRTDVSARLGGDEFVVLAPETGRDSAGVLANTLAEAIRGAAVAVPGGTVAVGASIGIATFPGDGDTAEALLAVADSAMYEAKRAAKAARAAAR